MSPVMGHAIVVRMSRMLISQNRRTMFAGTMDAAAQQGMGGKHQARQQVNENSHWQNSTQNGSQESLPYYSPLNANFVNSSFGHGL
jgi:hypothetical protein